MATAFCRRPFLAGPFFVIFSLNSLVAGPVPRDYPIQGVPFTAVHLDDAFWAPRLETNRAVTIPYAFGQCQASGRMDKYLKRHGGRRGPPHARMKRRTTKLPSSRRQF